MKRFFSFLIILGFFAIGSARLHAASITLGQATDNALRTSIANAAPGDEITFSYSLFATGAVILVLSDTIVIDKDLTIEGPGADLLTLDGNQKRIFFIKKGSLKLKNVRLANACAKGTFGGNGFIGGGGGAGMGGAIFVNTNACFCGLNVTIDHCSTLGGLRGASNCQLEFDGTLGSVASSELVTKPAGGGGGMGTDATNREGGSGWPLEGDDGAGGRGMLYHESQPTGNANGGFGAGSGGCYSSSGGQAGFGGGAGVAMNIYKVKESGLKIAYFPVPPINPGGEFGGSSYETVAGGGASLGGAIFVRSGGILLLDHCLFTNNSALIEHISYGQDVVTETQLNAKGKGGAIFVMNGATTKIKDCSFSENFAYSTNPYETGFTYNFQSDTSDVYGVINELLEGEVTAFPPPESTPTATPDSPVLAQYPFSDSTAEANGVTLQGAGFGAYPQAKVTFGAIPTDNAFAGATDGLGAIVQAKPGEGVMIFGARIASQDAAMIRCSVRTEGANAAVIIATIGDAPNQFVSYNTPNNGQYFAGVYRRLTTFCTPPSTGFQPVVQILNTSTTETLTAYVDNLEIFAIDTRHYYHGDFLNGDESDPVTVRVNTSELEATPTEQPVEPTSTSTPTATPTPSEPVSITPTPMPPPFSSLTVAIPGLPADATPAEFVLIPAGSFWMGSPVKEANRDPEDENQHWVTITKPFYIGKYEVTQAQWQSVMGSNPSHYTGINLPVEAISWEDTQVFIQKLNRLGLGEFRLPTEAEWEYACRAGTTTAFSWGDDPTYAAIGNFAWYYTERLDDQTHEVGLKKPNPWGLFDTNGNVWEWCQDWYTTPYPSDPQIDPLVPISPIGPVFRGGSWFSSPWGCRSANRSTGESGVGFSDAGLRLVRSVQ